MGDNAWSLGFWQILNEFVSNFVLLLNFCSGGCEIDRACVALRGFYLGEIWDMKNILMLMSRNYVLLEICV